MLNRREAFALMAGVGASTVFRPPRADAAAPDDGAKPPAYRGNAEPKPLPFDPTTLRGLSEKLLRSHHEHDYASAVRRLNLIRQQIGQLPRDAAPFRMGALKREELVATNSIVLHQIYFESLGGDGKAGGGIVGLINARYGSLETWEHDFRRTGLSLAGGSGWVVLAFAPHEQAVHNHASWDHAHAVAWGTPLLVMDMHEHAYALDYGADAKGYIDAFFANIDWGQVNRRTDDVRSQLHPLTSVESHRASRT